VHLRSHRRSEGNCAGNLQLWKTSIVTGSFVWNYIAAAAGGLGQPALDHDLGGAKELAEERGMPTHTIILGSSG